MAEHTPTPKLVLGHIVVFSLGDDNGCTPCDDALIHFEGDEDSEIEVHCPDALRLAPFIVKAVNNHDALVKALEEIEALGEKADLKNEIGIRAGNIAHAALIAIRSRVGGVKQP